MNTPENRTDVIEILRIGLSFLEHFIFLPVSCEESFAYYLIIKSNIFKEL